jgi:uncharacterized membrane protein
MVTVTVLVLVDIALRWFAYDADAYSGAAVLALTLVAAALTVIGGTIGGSVTYDYGFNVETSGDHPVWHPSEVDVFPGQKG